MSRDPHADDTRADEVAGRTVSSADGRNVDDRFGALGGEAAGMVVEIGRAHV